MKWFKHFSDSLDDPFIEELMDEFGHVGYVAFFGLIEIIAKENGHQITGKLDISPAVLRRKLRTTQTKLRHIFDFCSTNARLSFDSSGKRWSFDFPKMLEIKDNYTKDLQVTGKKPSNHKEVDVEEEVDVDKKKNKDYCPTSEEVRLSELLFSLIIKRDEKHKRPNIQKWAVHIDRLIRIDKRTPTAIETVIEWCQQDDFWQSNILSTVKLRQQFGSLKMKMDREKPQEDREDVIRRALQQANT